jgi:hypothetical protein
MSESVPAPGGKKTVYCRIGIWHNIKTDHIHIRFGSGKGEISTVSPDPISMRGNPHLWNKLKAILEEHGRWSESSV